MLGKIRHTLAAAAGGLLCVLACCVALPAQAAELIMFEEAGCVWCRRWHAEVGIAYPKTPEGKRAPLRRLDISQTSRAGVTLASRVTMTPTFVLAQDGREIGRITGHPGADFFWGMLSELLAKLPPDAPIPPGQRETHLELFHTNHALVAFANCCARPAPSEVTMRATN